MVITNPDGSEIQQIKSQTPKNVEIIQLCPFSETGLISLSTLTTD